MFEKIKKFWSSTSNLNGSNKASPKASTSNKSIKKIASIGRHESSRPLYYDEPRSVTRLVREPPNVSIERLYVEPNYAFQIAEETILKMDHSPVSRIRKNKSEHNLKHSVSTNEAFTRPEIYEKEEDRRAYMSCRKSEVNHQKTIRNTPNLQQHSRSQSYVQLSGHINQTQTEICSPISHNNPPNNINQGSIYSDIKTYSSAVCVSNLSTTPSPINNILENQIHMNQRYETPMNNLHHSRNSLTNPYSSQVTPLRHCQNGHSKGIYNNNRMMSEEVYIDLPPPRCSLPATFSANRIDQIEESLRDLQIQVNTSTAIQMQTGITQYSTPIGVPQKSNDEALIVLLIDKKKETDYLKDKLHKCQIKIENQQIQFSEELDKNHLEAESIRNKLKIMNERFNKLDTEYRQYKNSNIMENEKDLFNGRRSEQDYEAEINTLKDKLNNNKIAFAHTNQVNEDKTKVENQNVELSKQLKNKEAYIGQLKALLLLRTNKNSEGVLGKDDIGSLVSKDTKKSTKDGNRLDVHESMSPSNDKLFCSRYSSSNSSGFTESREHSTLPREREKQTHDHLTNSQSSSASSSNAADPGQTLPPRIQRIIRDSNELGKKLRCISKSIAQVSTNFVDGKDPEFHLLASRFSDSSESEDDCAESNLTKNQLEKLLRKHEEDLSKAEQFLGTLTGNILHFTTRQSSEYQQPSCSIQ